MKAQIMGNFVKSGMSHVSFVELLRGVPEGEVSMEIADKNIVLWSGLSDEAFAAFEEIRMEELIEPTPADPLSYMIDGAGLTLPIAKRDHSYKKPHWLPIVFNPGKKFILSDWEQFAD